jgi:hypothetical protein
MMEAAIVTAFRNGRRDHLFGVASLQPATPRQRRYFFQIGEVETDFSPRRINLRVITPPRLSAATVDVQGFVVSLGQHL